MWTITNDLVDDGKKVGIASCNYDEAKAGLLQHRFRPGQTHLNFNAQEFEEVAVVPAGVLLFAFDPSLLGLLPF